MRVLALDLSTKTGWALFDDSKLIGFGNLGLSKPVKDHGEYPENFLVAIMELTGLITKVILETSPGAIVIEETNLGRQRYSQKMLEFLHFSVLLWLKANCPKPIKYVSTSAWRSSLKMYLTKDDRKHNAIVNKANRQHLSKKELGLTGKVTQKHLSVKFVNGMFGLNLKLKDNDIADAICLGWAYLINPNIKVCDGR